MILADSSAWVEYLRATGSPAHLRLRQAQEAGELAATDAVVMEVLAGAIDTAHHDKLRRLLARAEFLATEGPQDYEQAAALYRTCRQKGETIRKLTDCLIAVVAIRKDVCLLHADRDFDAIARHAPLKIV